MLAVASSDGEMSLRIQMKSNATLRRPLAVRAALLAVCVLLATVAGCSEPEAPTAVTVAPEATEPVETKPAAIPRSPLEHLKDSAAVGNVNQQLQLAVKYSTGSGVDRDQSEASRWYLMAAQSGHPQAMYEVSMRYWHGLGLTKNEAEADVWRQRAASAGIPEAQYEMAHTFGVITGKGALISDKKNSDRGHSSRQLVMWLTRAAESGSAAAKHELAIVKLFGILTGGADKAGYLVPLPSVTASAIQLLTENAEAGYWRSQQFLAELQQIGNGEGQPNQAESDKWWARLDSQTDASVQTSIGRSYLATDGSRYRVGENKWKGKSLSFHESNKVAFDWFSRAASQGDADALWQLASMKYLGLGTSRDPQSAMQDHRKAAELGQIEAMYNLGIAYADGNVVPKDYTSALRWLNKTIAHEGAYGSNPLRSQAQSALGTLHENGNGVGTDLLTAYALYSLAAAAGDLKAKEHQTRVEQLLKPEQLLEAQSQARAWKPGSEFLRRAGSAGS